MVLPDTKELEPDLVGEHDRLEQVALRLRRAHEFSRGGIRRLISETVDTELHAAPLQRVVMYLYSEASDRDGQLTG
ncbi:hypothetical protein GCM10009692_05570 [Leucobacter aridicollis]